LRCPSSRIAGFARDPSAPTGRADGVDTRFRSKRLELYDARPVPVALEHARQEWEQGHRRLQATSGDARLHRRLLEQVEVMTVELRRRVGQKFTLAELAEAYGSADDWSREALMRDAASADLAHAATVEDAAFHLHSRGAVDYVP
jgi:hypothetical protein